MLACSLATYANLIPDQLINSDMPTEGEFKFHYFPGVGGGGN